MSRDGDDGKVETVGPPGGRIDRARPGRAHAAADHVGAEHEIAVGVDRLAGADHGLPPAGLAGDGMDVGDVLVAGQRMTDENEIRLAGVERAVGLVGDGERARARRRNRAAAARRRKCTISLCGLAICASRPNGRKVLEGFRCLRFTDRYNPASDVCRRLILPP